MWRQHLSSTYENGFMETLALWEMKASRSDEKDKSLMPPVVKSGDKMEEPGENVKHVITAKSQSPVSKRLIQTPSSLFPEPRSADHRNCLLWFFQPAVRQDITLHSHPLSGSVWAGVSECVGRCSPQSWNRSKTSLQRHCHLHNGEFGFLISFLKPDRIVLFFFFFWLHLSALARLVSSSSF